MKPAAGSTPFLILALPRSRTAWIANFLTYGDWLCGHEQLRYMRSMEDVRSWLAMPCTGSVETAAAPFWRSIPRQVRLVTVRRPQSEVISSMIALGFDPAETVKYVRRADAKLDQVEARRECVRIDANGLTEVREARRLWTATLPHPFDVSWHARHVQINVQYPVPLLLRYYLAHDRQLREFAEDVRVASRPRRPWTHPLAFNPPPFRRPLAQELA